MEETTKEKITEKIIKYCVNAFINNTMEDGYEGNLEIVAKYQNDELHLMVYDLEKYCNSLDIIYIIENVKTYIEYKELRVVEIYLSNDLELNAIYCD